MCYIFLSKELFTESRFRYARYTHGRELDLIGATVQYVTSTASHADDVFDELEKEEMELTNSLSGLMKSSQFESLSKVMEASEYVEKVTMDNADVVSYLQEAEPNSIQWMNTVLQALEQAHDLMVAQQAKNAAEEQADEANAAAQSQLGTGTSPNQGSRVLIISF